jgi:hypothetical protein
MSVHSIYLRSQSDKCVWHAKHIVDPETQKSLRKLAAEYIQLAVKIESKE